MPCIKWSEGNVKQKRRKVEGIQEAGEKEEKKGKENKFLHTSTRGVSGPGGSRIPGLMSEV